MIAQEMQADGHLRKCSFELSFVLNRVVSMLEVERWHLWIELGTLIA